MRALRNSRLDLVFVLLAVVVIGALFVIKRSSLAVPNGARQGRIFFGLRDVTLPLSGHAETTPVTDWSFVNKAPTAQIETRPWYPAIPYTVTLQIAASPEGRVYLFSDYLPPEPGQPDFRGRFPEARAWNRNIIRDPRIRLKVGGRLFDCVAYPLADVSEIEDGRKAFLAKYAYLVAQQKNPEPQRPRMYMFRVIPQWGNPAILDAHARAASGL